MKLGISLEGNVKIMWRTLVYIKAMFTKLGM